MIENFSQSLKWVLLDEGGNDDDPHDHGGRTSRGITQREYSAWLKEQGRPNADVWQAPQEDVERIYKENYWDPWCDRWPTGIDYCIFDLNVNAGPYRCTTLVQRTVRVNEDGRIGPITRAAVLNYGPEKFIHDFAAVKRIWYRSLNQPRFTKGWINRTNHVEANAMSMLKGTS